MKRHPDRVEFYERFTCEFLRGRNSRGEEQLIATIYHDSIENGQVTSREFSTDIDALERFASYKVPASDLEKPIDGKNPDRVEKFREYTASFHSGRLDSGKEVSLINLEFEKTRDDGTVVEQSSMWVSLDALKDFSLKAIAYEQELGIEKRWHPKVHVVGLGWNDEGMVRSSGSVENVGQNLPLAQLSADRSSGEVLWPEAFRRPFMPGEQFTVRGQTEEYYGNGRIRIGIDQEITRRDKIEKNHIIGVFHDTSCKPYVGMEVRFNDAFDLVNGRPREMLVFPDGPPRSPGEPEEREILLVKVDRQGRGTVEKMFGDDMDRAVATLHEIKEQKREQRQSSELEQSQARQRQNPWDDMSMPQGYRP